MSEETICQQSFRDRLGCVLSSGPALIAGNQRKGSRPSVLWGKTSGSALVYDGNKLANLLFQHSFERFYLFHSANNLLMYSEMAIILVHCFNICVFCLYLFVGLFVCLNSLPCKQVQFAICDFVCVCVRACVRVCVCVCVSVSVRLCMRACVFLSQQSIHPVCSTPSVSCCP